VNAIVNRCLVGFRNYYGLKHAGKQLNKIDWYVLEKFTVWNSESWSGREHIFKETGVGVPQGAHTLWNQ
jgi:hypothetical protein